MNEYQMCVCEHIKAKHREDEKGQERCYHIKKYWGKWSFSCPCIKFKLRKQDAKHKILQDYMNPLEVNLINQIEECKVALKIEGDTPRRKALARQINIAQDKLRKMENGKDT